MTAYILSYLCPFANEYKIYKVFLTEKEALESSKEIDAKKKITIIPISGKTNDNSFD